MKSVPFEKTRCPNCKSRRNNIREKWTSGHVTSRKHKCESCGEVFVSRDYGERQAAKIIAE